MEVETVVATDIETAHAPLVQGGRAALQVLSAHLAYLGRKVTRARKVLQEILVYRDLLGRRVWMDCQGLQDAMAALGEKEKADPEENQGYPARKDYVVRKAYLGLMGCLG